jgi:23S rRNA (cytidine2498-2'-O)-methyltransferase
VHGRDADYGANAAAASGAMSRKARTVRGRNAAQRGRARPHPSAAKHNPSRDAVNPRRRQRDAVGARQPKRDTAGAYQPKRDAAGAYPPKRDAASAYQPKRDAAGAPKHARSVAHRNDRGGAARGPRQDEHRPPRAARGAIHAPQPTRLERPAVDPAVLAACLSSNEPLRVGEWLWTMREGAERDLIEELLLRSSHARRPRKLAPALVASADAPADEDARLAVTFARQAFQVAHIARADSLEALAAELTPAIASCLESTQRYALQVFVPDSESGNPLAARAESLQAALTLPTHAERVPDAELRRHGGLLLQLCLLSHDTAAVGGIAADCALSLWPGGRARMRLAGDLPSRAARKLAEAFSWLGMAPSSGESCVDLGAAPGGWSWLLLDRRARVIAIDPARMDPKLMNNPRLTHVQGSAFDFAPDEPVDWLFCDMVWRPLEVAQMLGRWARRRDTRMLVANFKLPMKRKVETVEQLRAVLSASGYTGIRTRQLYHDRDEITLTAHVR